MTNTKLTPQEMLEQYSRGKTPDDIAKELGISTAMVRGRMSRLVGYDYAKKLNIERKKLQRLKEKEERTKKA